MSEQTHDQASSPAEPPAQGTQPPPPVTIAPEDPREAWIADAAPGISLALVSVGLYIAMKQKWVHGADLDGAKYLALPYFLLFFGIMRGQTEFILERYAKSKLHAILTIVVVPLLVLLLQAAIAVLGLLVGAFFIQRYDVYAKFALGTSAAGIVVYWVLALGFLALKGSAAPATRKRWFVPRGGFVVLGVLAAFLVSTQT